MLELSPEEALAWTCRETARRCREEDEDRRVELLPPEAFSDEYAPAERLKRVRRGADPRATGPDSQTVRGLICGACAGWRNPPTSRELVGDVFDVATAAKADPGALRRRSA